MTAQCSIDLCGRAAFGRGWCNTHYQRWRRLGDPNVGGPIQVRRTFEERFWDKVEVRGPQDCWPWTGAITNGYGRVGYGRRNGVRYAHRAVMEIVLMRTIPEGMVVMHSCDNPPCVNPAHLSIGTVAENMRDAVAKSRHANVAKTHCPHGHPYAGANLRVDARGHRFCKACARGRAA